MTVLGANSERSDDKKVQRLEYYVLLPVTGLNRIRVELELMKKCFDPVVANFSPLFNGLSVSYAVIPIMSAEGEQFLGPFFALAVPSPDRFEGSSWERRPPMETLAVLRQEGWTALNVEAIHHLKSEEEKEEFSKTRELCEQMRDEFYNLCSRCADESESDA